VFRLWRHQGMSVPDTVRHASKRVIFEEYPVLGYNYRMTDIQAAVGREQLKRLPDILERHRALARRYREQLSDLPGLVLPEEPSWARSNWQSFCVRLPEHCDQRRTMQSLLDAGVATRRGIMCCHRESPHQNARCVASPDAPPGLPESERAQDRALLLPVFHGMTIGQQDRVASLLREACKT
jgi:perosamine synthetase